MTMILNCQLCGRRFYANTEHICPTTDSRIIELLEKILDRMPEPEKTHPCPGCGTFTDKRVCNSCWGTSDDPEAGYSQAECIEDVPAPADDGLAEWERELFRPAICCGKCPPIVGGGYDCTCEGNPKCRCGSVRFGYPDHICTKPPRHEGPHGYAGVFWSEPGPADDLPGEPVEPGDLRAGDRVEYDYEGLRYSSTLSAYGNATLRSDSLDPDGFIPNVVVGGEWCHGISDVRLIERAPREDEDPDGALARHSDDANCEWAQYRKDYGVDPTVATHKAFHAGFKAAREHIEARETYTEEGGRILMDELAATRARAEKAEAEVARVTTDLEASRASNDEWIERARRKAAERNAMTDDRDSWEQKASEAEAALADERDRHDATITERDALRKRLDAFRADVARYESEMGYVSAYTKVQLLAVKNKLVNILARERARQEGN